MLMSKKELAPVLDSLSEALASTPRTAKMATKSKSNRSDRLMIEVGKHRMPMKQLLDKREIREAMAELEKYRQKFNEKEFFYGIKVYLSYGQGECWAILKRPETDKEYSDRQAYVAEEQRRKAERARMKQLKEYEAEQRRIAEAAARKAQEEAEELERALAVAAKYGYKLVDH